MLKKEMFYGKIDSGWSCCHTFTVVRVAVTRNQPEPIPLPQIIVSRRPLCFYAVWFALSL